MISDQQSVICEWLTCLSAPLNDRINLVDVVAVQLVSEIFSDFYDL